MKLRIKGNSIRLRIMRSEVETLGTSGHLSEETHFGPSVSLSYTLSVSSAVEAITARFAHNNIEILLPKATSYNWLKGDAVSLEGEQAIDGNSSLSILIERDFVCLDRPDDPDNVDAFPHPKVNC